MAERTRAQQQAITARGGSVIVSAGAGSGKTTVLVDRLVGLLTDQDNPASADRILVLTFTRASAQEMRKRVLDQMSQKIDNAPYSSDLQRQMIRLQRSHIGTLHALCAELVRLHFQQLGIARDMTIDNENQCALLMEQAANAVLERRYAQDDPHFLRLVELMCPADSDRPLAQTITALHEDLSSHPFMNDWMSRSLALYDPDIPVAESIWGREVLSRAADAADYGIGALIHALEDIRGVDKIEGAYGPALQADLETLSAVRERIVAGEWDAARDTLRAYKPVSLKALRRFEDEGLKASVQGARNRVKELIANMRDNDFCASSTEHCADMEYLQPVVATLFALIHEFQEELWELKLQNRVLSFNDLEHLTLRLLLDGTGESAVKTVLAHELSEQYEHIFVDEYQDLSEVQELIITSLSRDETNLFTVGDVKQSIYRFRRANPDIFIRRRKAATPYDGEHYPARVTLPDNFRSAPGIVAFVNALFTPLMSKRSAGFDFDEGEQLVARADMPPDSEPPVSMLLCEDDREAEHPPEAVMIAREIRRIMQSDFLVKDRDGLRPPVLSDFCVLMRSPKNRMASYLAAFEACGLTGDCSRERELLRTREIEALISVLRVVDNPLDDIHLAAALLGEVFCFTPDEVAEIRIFDRNGRLFDALLLAAQRHDRVKTFVERLDSYRDYAARHGAGHVVRHIVEDTLMIPLFTLVGGAQAGANLRLFMRYTSDFDRGGKRNLGALLRNITMLMDSGRDIDSAKNVHEQDTVRIMSVHNAKGLEFPVVFFADCARAFNLQDDRAFQRQDEDLGFALKRRLPDSLVQFRTVAWQAVHRKQRADTIAEELRLLYVALTRAKQRLIMTATVGKINEKINGFTEEKPDAVRYPAHLITSQRNPLSLLGLGIAASPYREALRDGVSADGLLSVRVEGSIEAPDAAAERQEELTALPGEQVRAISERLAFTYPHEMAVLIPQKLGASELAKEESAYAYKLRARPRFDDPQALSPRERGNAHHRFMQFCDFARAHDDVRAELERLVRDDFLTRQEADAIRPDRLRAFFDSPLFARIGRAQEVLREFRFLYEIDAGGYDERFDGLNESIVVQGVADLVFVENGALVIVDYKSDSAKNEDYYHEQYTKQLDIYADALAEILGRPVRERVIYSFAMKKALSV